MDKKITVYDVAKECQVSVSTVSRVLNGSVLVGDDRRGLIIEAADRLGYKKRVIQRQSRRAILNVELFLPESRSHLMHIFYDISDLVDGVGRGFGEVKVNIITKINRPEERFYTHKKLGDIDGCIFAFTEPDPKLKRQMLERNIPVALLNRKQPGAGYVRYDEKANMGLLLEKVLARRLAADGGVKPLFIGFDPIHKISVSRTGGMREACGRFGISFEPERDAVFFKSVPEIFAAFADRRFFAGRNAVFCVNDAIASSIYQAAGMYGYDIPRDFSLTGFDDSPVLEMLPRRIDTIKLDVGLMAREAAAWLKRRVVKRDADTLAMELPGEYIPGETI